MNIPSTTTTSLSTTISFATPEHSPSEVARGSVGPDRNKQLHHDENSRQSALPNVTPSDKVTNKRNNERVTEDSPDNNVVMVNLPPPIDRVPSNDSSGVQRGFVSRRGGRVGTPSPARLTSIGSDVSEDLSSTSLLKSSNTNPASAPSTKPVAPISLLPRSKSNEESSHLDSTQQKSHNLHHAQLNTNNRKDHDSTLSSRRSPVNDDLSKTPRNVTFSPVPSKATTKSNIMKTPQQPSRNNKNDLYLLSPGFFLSPFPDYDKNENEADDNEKTGRTTPVNFVNDYGKVDLMSPTFPWLSPSLLSPGGFTSKINTPRGTLGIPRTPCTPSFLMDEANLSGNHFLSLGTFIPDFDTKNLNGVPPVDKGAPNSFSSICVSPLASNKRAGYVKIDKSHKLETPVNMKDVFNSPIPDSNYSKAHEIPVLPGVVASGSPKSLAAKLNFEKHIAERDVYLDKDLKDLLELTQATPPIDKHDDSIGRTRGYKAAKGGGAWKGPNLSSLQIPLIDKNSSNKNIRQGKNNIGPAPAPLMPSGHKSADGKSDSKSKKRILLNAKESEKSLQHPGQYPSIHHKSPVYDPSQFAKRPPNMPPPPIGGGYLPPPQISGYRGAPIHPPYYHPYGPGHPPRPPYSMYPNTQLPPPQSVKTDPNKNTEKGKRQNFDTDLSPNKKSKKQNSKKSKFQGSGGENDVDRQKSAATIAAINSATGNKNEKAAALASAIMRGVTMRPSGKWQAQLYYAGKSRYIGVFDTREKAALAYEIAREVLKTDRSPADQCSQSPQETEANVNAARKAAFAGVDGKDKK